MTYPGLIELPFSALGFGVGLLVGLTGVGGGSLMTPLLILLFGVHPVTAVGTDLLFAAGTKTVGTLMNGLHGMVDWRVTARLAAGSLPATALTLFVVSSLDAHNDAAGAVISAILCAALLLTAVSLILRKQILHFAAARLGAVSPHLALVLTVLTGAALGVLVSLSSVGAGAIGIMALLLLYPRLPIARIVGSDIAHAVPLTLLAGIGHWVMGTVQWGLLASLLAGSLPGIVLGSYFAPRIPDLVLRTVLAITLVVVAGKMVI
ncbi:sulfite exporter TauE/SafE family protein [Limobrevibacterium gyesilva]|uniref:Probable membrane transporter protein n=1 Tax=Limobrevibacterium gyesilva TaxID=2991712 RepID=A0AA41YPS5_9PROT|nr:sulfite exporter TauE/SafE family protein [Limobrevibacterium gyesilva]MCW3477869.1 sulfite exporter TauE/SafE family protein [Limobrevibacterium gyesilva]